MVHRLHHRPATPHGAPCTDQACGASEAAEAGARAPEQQRLGLAQALDLGGRGGRAQRRHARVALAQRLDALLGVADELGDVLRRVERLRGRGPGERTAPERLQRLEDLAVCRSAPARS